MLIEGIEFETDDEWGAPPAKASHYQELIRNWNLKHCSMAVRFVREDKEDGCTVIDVFGNELQVYTLDGGDGFFVSTDDDDDDEQLNSILTELNDTSTLQSLEALLSHAVKLIGSFQQSCAPFLNNSLPDEAINQESEPLSKNTIVCDIEGMRQVQEQHIRKLSRNTGLDASTATLLLLNLKWDVAEAQNCLLNRRTETLAKAGIILAPENVSTCTSSLCAVCFADAPTSCLPCGHGLCSDCWPAFLKCNLESGTVAGDNCLRLKCPGERCPLLIPPHLFQEYLVPCDFARYQRLLILEFLRETPNVAQCPAVGCELCVAGSKHGSTASCACGHLFCFTCKQEAHAPSTCVHAKQWLSKRETANVGKQLRSSFVVHQEKLTETKPCPNPECGTLTHKETGCHYLSCTQCRENWCWQCGEWGGGPSGRPEPHHVGACNNPKNKNWMVKDVTLLDSDARFAFYFERHENHMKSLDFAKQLRKSTAEMIRDIASGASPDVAYGTFGINLIQEAVELLVECRLVLAWTYVWAFFEKQEGRRRLFEFTQRDLEVKTEQLSSMIEVRPAQNILQKIELAQLRNYVLALRGYLENIKQYEDPKQDEPDMQQKIVSNHTSSPEKALPRYMRSRANVWSTGQGRQIAPKAPVAKLAPKPAVAFKGAKAVPKKQVK